MNLEPANDFSPVVFVAPHGRVLLRRAKDTYDLSTNTVLLDDRPEHYLVDPQTGATQLVSGEFLPLHQQGKRFLQPTDKPNEFWAAIPNSEKNQTQVGRYNLKDFSFKPLLLIPHISFESMSMWVDVKSEKLYVVYKNQLLRLPFSSSVK